MFSYDKANHAIRGGTLGSFRTGGRSGPAATIPAEFMTAPFLPSIHPCQRNLKLCAEPVAGIAANHADAVDREARFPTEAFAAVRAERLLSLLVPVELGGEGASVSDVVDVCYALGRACASSGMVFAMHQIMVAILVRHARDSAWHQRMLRRLSAEQLLLASSTTEGTGGGDVRASACAVRLTGGSMSLEKNTTVMSYGAEADAILTTARRSADSAASDQVLVALLKEDYRLERLSGWDALGMRGTCSAGFVLQGDRADPEQVLPTPYQEIHTQLDAADRASHLERRVVRRRRRRGRTCAEHSCETRRRSRRPVAAGRGPPHPVPPRRCKRFRALALRVATRDTRRSQGTAGDSTHLAFQTAMNLLKVNASETALATVMSALQA